MRAGLSSAALAVTSFTCLARAHMQMSDPPPLLSKYNKYTTNQDYDMTSPLHADGSNYPCKGHLDALGTSQAQSVADWMPGQSYSMTISGSVPHNGGSCQASISRDNGKSWKVIHSYIGNCPVMGDSKYEFTLPGDTPAGNMLFAWTWFNKVGNREMYMNCAVINVLSATSSKKRRGTSDSIYSRPDMFIANIGNGCGTSEGKDVMFPDPGPDVNMDSTNITPPTGNCNVAAQSVPSDAPVSPPPPPAMGSPGTATSTRVIIVKPFREPLRFANTTSMAPYGGQNSTVSSSPASSPEESPAAATTAAPSTTEPAEPASTSSQAAGSQCMPGSYQCAMSPSGGQGWQVCDVSGSWEYAGDCGPNQVCKFDAANGSPYCVAPDFQFS